MWPESVYCAVLFCFFLFPPAGEICVFTISWRKLEAQYTLCVCVCQAEGEKTYKKACESVCMQRVEQLNSILNSPELQKRTISPDRRRKQRQPIYFAPFLYFILDNYLNGCNVVESFRILDLF